MDAGACRSFSGYVKENWGLQCCCCSQNFGWMGICVLCWGCAGSHLASQRPRFTAPLDEGQKAPPAQRGRGEQSVRTKRFKGCWCKQTQTLVESSAGMQALHLRVQDVLQLTSEIEMMLSFVDHITERFSRFTCLPTSPVGLQHIKDDFEPRWVTKASSSHTDPLCSLWCTRLCGLSFRFLPLGRGSVHFRLLVRVCVCVFFVFPCVFGCRKARITVCIWSQRFQWGTDHKRKPRQTGCCANSFHQDED